MAKEIERKFLVKDDSFKSLAIPELFIQGYICTEPERTVRVRVEGENGKLTIKGKNKGITRDEFEYSIPLSDAKALIRDFCHKGVIEKLRYKIKHNDLLWEVDQYKGDNEGLVIAEVELTSEDQHIVRPQWIGEEVSGDARYFNSNLSLHPFLKWNK